MWIQQMSFTLSMAPNPHHLSSLSPASSSVTSIQFLGSKLSHLSLHTQSLRRKITVIRMGGGPRTYPGGVSKWQWKRMQAKKAKQLLKARLARERQIYEMRKRAELKAAASELERPWDVVERAPNLFSVRADEQLKVLADRFQRPGGFDMWTDRDGPQLVGADDEVPSARFFPKGVVHSVKPYARTDGSEGGKVSGRQFKEKGQYLESGEEPKQTGKMKNGKLRRKRNNSDKFGQPGGLNDSQVHDMSLQGDGTYGLQPKTAHNSAAKEEIAKLRFF